MTNKLKYLIPALLIFNLILPERVFAVLGTGMFDYFTAIFEGVEEKAGPISKGILLVAFLYAIGLLLLAISSGLLEIILLNPQWLRIRGSVFVETGFGFVSGLANMLLILIFIVIAFALILKIETIQAKRALPRLIIVALLINFSLLFIGMLVDISNILYGTILHQFVREGGRSLLTLVFERLVGGANTVLQNVLAWIGALGLAFALPFVGPFTQLGLIIGLGGLILPNLFTWVFQIVCMFLLSAVLFMLSLFFAARIFIIQILAILSPLAFVCLILPQTEEHWQKWLKHLLQWIFMGLFVLFFLVLGLMTIHHLIPHIAEFPVPFPGVGWARLTEYFVYYFLLFIYLLIVAWLAQKTTPILGEFILASSMAWGKRIRLNLESGAKQLWAKSKEITRRGFAEAPPATWRARVLEKARRMSEYQPRGRFARTIGTVIPFHYAVRGIGQALGPALVEAEKAEIKKAEVETEKIETPELAYSKFRQAISTNRLTEAAGILSKSIERGGAFKGKFLQELRNEPDIVIRVASVANRVGATRQAERIGRAFIHLADQMGLARTRADLIDEARDREINDFAPGFWREPTAMARIQRNWGGDRLAKAAEEFRQEFVRDYMTARDALVQRVGIDEVIRRNLSAALYCLSTPARMLGFRNPRGFTSAQIRAIIRSIIP